MTEPRPQCQCVLAALADPLTIGNAAALALFLLKVNPTRLVLGGAAAGILAAWAR